MAINYAYYGILYSFKKNERAIEWNRYIYIYTLYILNFCLYILYMCKDMERSLYTIHNICFPQIIYDRILKFLTCVFAILDWEQKKRVGAGIFICVFLIFSSVSFQ